MKKLSIIIFCLVLTMLTLGATVGCSPQHECEHACVTCGLCTDSNCTEDACSEKCSCQIEVCKNECPYCGLCTDTECSVENTCQTKCACEPLNVTKQSYKMLQGKIWETPYYSYSTNKEGPRIAIVGGIHGDETAGWGAALDLVEAFDNAVAGESSQLTFGLRGTVLLLPKASIVACNKEQRYPKNDSNYSDLNRAFNYKRNQSATQYSIAIADAIAETVEAFQPDIIIDLHESQKSYTETKASGDEGLGDTLIYKNEPLFMDDLIYYYNTAYLQSGETPFTSNPTSVSGSFNLYFSEKYPNNVVFTIETTRNYVSGVGNTVDLSVRIRQQLNILNSLFDIVWERVDLSAF